MVKRGKSCDSLILIISYTFVALWYWLAVQELANIALKLKGRGRIDISTVFDMDQLGKIGPYHLKERIELLKFAKFKSDTF